MGLSPHAWKGKREWEGRAKENLMAVNTKSVGGRRRVRFNDYDEMMADVHALGGGPIRQLGNWTLGQICSHLAIAMHSCIDGPPFMPAWYVRLVGPLLKRRALTRGLGPGFQLPRNAVALLPPEVGAAEGIAELAKSVERVRRDPSRKPHIVFGNMTREEWDQFLLRHAELHLSFILPDAHDA
jgi:hypothetical protein